MSGNHIWPPRYPSEFLLDEIKVNVIKTEVLKKITLYGTSNRTYRRK